MEAIDSNAAGRTCISLQYAGNNIFDKISSSQVLVDVPSKVDPPGAIVEGIEESQQTSEAITETHSFSNEPSTRDAIDDTVPQAERRQEVTREKSTTLDDILLMNETNQEDEVTVIESTTAHVLKNEDGYYKITDCLKFETAQPIHSESTSLDEPLKEAAVDEALQDAAAR